MIDLETSRYWEEFEALTLEMLKSQFSIYPDLVYVTTTSNLGKSNDNTIHRIANKDKLKTRQLILLEAKLRSQDDWGLQSFVTTLVIAFNLAAQTLIVVSNKRFSREVLEQAAIFHWKTGVQMLLVDGPTLAHWIRINFEHVQQSYSKQFLAFLLEDNYKKREYQKVHIDRVGLPGANHLGMSVPLAASIEFGWRSDTEIAPCRMTILKGKNLSYEPSLELVGAKRKLLARELTEALGRSPGILVAKGQAGVGKTTIIHRCLRDVERPTAILDFNLISTDRQLFVKTLSALTGVDLLAAIGPDSTSQAISRMFQETETIQYSEEIRSAVVSVLSESGHSIGGRSDLNSRLLLDFLEIAVASTAQRIHPIVVYENLNRGSAESLGFLVPLSQALTKSGVTVIIEIRDGSDTPALSASEWESFVSIFQRIATSGTFLIEPLSDQDADDLLAELLPGLGYDRWQVIRKRVGNIPLFLRSAAAWLRAQGVLRGEGQATVVEDLQIFFEGISPGACIALLDRLISSARERPDFPMADCISAASLFKGRLTRQMLEIVCPNMPLAHLAEKLCESSIFANDASYPLELKVTHDLLLERMQCIDQGRPFRRACVAEALVSQLDSLVSNSEERKARRVDLLVAMGKWYEAYPQALEVGERLALTRQWAESSHYLDIAHQAANHFTNYSERQTSLIHSLVRFLEVEQERYRIGLAENINRIQGLKLMIRIYPTISDTVDGTDLILRSILLEWRAYFIRERFGSALKLSRKAKRIALSMGATADLELRGAAVASYGINLKAIEQREKSVAVFEEGRKVIPDSLILLSEQLSNLASAALQDDPAKALEFYQRIIHNIEGKNYPVLRTIHVHVDVAMAYFLMRQYDKAKISARNAFILAEANGVPAQEARSRNILGCCHWAAEQIEDADRQFDCAGLASERTLSLRFLWRIRTNRAGTALELGKYDEAIENARSSEELILRPRASLAKKIAKYPVKCKARWYAALLVIGKCYRTLGSSADYERLSFRIGLADFETNIDALMSGKFEDLGLLNSPLVHAQRMMITG